MRKALIKNRLTVFWEPRRKNSYLTLPPTVTSVVLAAPIFTREKPLACKKAAAFLHLGTLFITILNAIQENGLTRTRAWGGYFDSHLMLVCAVVTPQIHDLTSEK